MRTGGIGFREFLSNILASNAKCQYSTVWRFFFQFARDVHLVRKMADPLNNRTISGRSTAELSLGPNIIYIYILLLLLPWWWCILVSGERDVAQR